MSVIALAPKQAFLCHSRSATRPTRFSVHAENPLTGFDALGTRTKLRRVDAEPFDSDIVKTVFRPP